MAIWDRLVWEHASHDRLQLNTALFVVSFVYTLAAALSSGIPGRAKIAFTASAVHFLAGFSYFLMSRNIVPLVLSPNSGRPVVLARVFEWSVTVPCLLSLIGEPPAGALLHPTNQPHHGQPRGL
jgi:bacteriorhodopsin